MKKILVLLVFTATALFAVSAQDSAIAKQSDTLEYETSTIDSFSVEKVIMPDELRAFLSRKDTSQKVIAIKETIAPDVFADTQRVIIYDTIQVVEESTKKEIESSSSIQDKLLPNLAPKESVTPLGEIISFQNIFWSLIILIATYFLIKALVVIIERFAEKSTNYRITLKSLSPFVRIIGWIVATIWIVEGVFELDNDTLFAFLASAGLAIGFASQDILKNIFGGIMILFDKPFQVGDKIEVGAIYGEVKEIGLRSTRIVTKDDSLVSVPNAEVVNTAVSNSNAGEANCQVVAEIYLPIDTDTNAARLVATEAAQISRYIYLNKPITVLFFNEVMERKSYLKMRVKAYVSDIRNEFAFKSDMTEIIMKEFLKEGIFKKEDVQ